MMLMFGKKSESKPVPIADIQAMTKRGMSDKDIIKSLKSRGYSYNDIEKAMLTAVKSGVSEERPSKQPQAADRDFSTDFGDEPQNESFDNMGTEDIFAGQAPVQQQYSNQQPGYQDLPQLSQEPQQPVEELIEGVVEEKWQRFQEELGRFEDGLEKLRADVAIFEERIEATKKESPAAEFETRAMELSDRMDDLDARVGGLERAFKQFLPGLTRNIESLSALVNEIKAKQEPKNIV